MWSARNFREYIAFAFSASAVASQWWLAAVGSVIAWLVFQLTGSRDLLSNVLPPDPFAANAVIIIISVIIGVVFFFCLLLLYAPVHFLVTPHGGPRAYLRTRLGVQMWPIIMMISGVSAFVLLFGSGAAWYLMLKLSAGSSQRALPPNAKFQLGNTIFWFAKAPYAPTEAERILEASEEVQNLLEGRVVPAVLHVKTFVQQVSGNLKGVGGPTAAREKLRDIDQNELIPSFQAVYELINQKYPSYRNDIQADDGSFGTLRSKLGQFDAKLQVLPDDASSQLLDATAGSAKIELLNSADAFLRSLGEYGSQLALAKPELRALIHRSY
ncbi:MULTISPECIES: hypothetical protein [unclassified Bradyrhizobium]|uniref:hypothetical protein n=1 Tax=unclassified Bradyrhizobium TaxID=2631580 RepID=UPI002916CF54|nr:MULTISPECIES: hypothetical protein [unclassified Bradyrhizobium]